VSKPLPSLVVSDLDPQIDMVWQAGRGTEKWSSIFPCPAKYLTWKSQQNQVVIQRDNIPTM
jgi:hypothetical protein